MSKSLIHKNIDVPYSNTRVIFFSGLGLPIHEQGEESFHEFALNNTISYLALDYTAYANENSKKNSFGMSTVFDETTNVLSACKEENIVAFGACFGALMALKSAETFVSKFKGIVATSPLIELPELPLKNRIELFLRDRANTLKKRKIGFDNLKKLALFHQMIISALKNQATSYKMNNFSEKCTIFHGKRDQLIPYQNSILLQNSSENNNIDLQIVPNRGHNLNVSDSISVPINILRTYLSKIK